MSQFESKFESLNTVPQKKYRSSSQRVMLNILYTSNWLSGKIKEILDEESITMQQFNILRILRGAGTPLSLLKIRESMLDKMSDTSRLIDRMEIKNLVKKSSSENDKRVLEITLTEKGKRLLSRIDHKEDYLDSIVSNITEEEANIICKLLDKIRGVIHE